MDIAKFLRTSILNIICQLLPLVIQDITLPVIYTVVNEKSATYKNPPLNTWPIKGTKVSYYTK